MKLRAASILMLLLLSCLALVPAQPAVGDRIVAVGDIHGSLEGLKTILLETGILDGDLEWIGESATLVQTGDFTDRGAETRAVMDLLIELPKKARRKGGRVEILLGNHEIMNLIGDLRYVTPEIYATFSDEDSEERRQKALQKYLKWLTKRTERQGQELEDEKAVAEQWLKSHPPGFLEYRELLAPKGHYGKWLKKLPAIVERDDIVFVHGGISPELSKAWSLERVNRRVRKEIDEMEAIQKYLAETESILPFFTLDEMVAAVRQELEYLELFGNRGDRHEEALRRFLQSGSWLIMNPDGPFWFRGFANWSEQEGNQQVTRIATLWDVERFVVGHTVSPSHRIRSRFEGRVFLIDTGMLSSHYGGEPSALQIVGTRVEAVYADEKEVLQDFP